jgi:hypothetical protein
LVISRSRWRCSTEWIGCAVTSKPSRRLRVKSVAMPCVGGGVSHTV